MDGSTSNCEEEEEELSHKNVAILGAATAAMEIWQNQMTIAVAYYAMLRNPLEREDRKRERELYISTLTRGQEAHCISQLRMNKDCFDLLCRNLRNRELLQDTRGVKVEEQVVLFLHTVAHNVRNRTNAVRFFRSGETISRQFHRVLRAINALAPDIIRQVGNDAPRGPVGFEGAVGAIDGTHIPAFVPSQLQSTFRNRKGTLSQTVMVACGFDLNFQYVLPGWEGSATDARVLQNALARPDPLIVPRAMSTKKNNVFNAVMDDEMLTLLQEQIEMGKKGDRGFKEEAYTAVASAMTESSNGTYIMTSSSVKNRYKHLKQLYYAMKELMNASGFGYDPVSKRVVADEALWNTWLEGHPTARPLKTKSIDYEKMGLVCGNDMATGQFARSSTSAPSVDLMQESSNFSNSDDVPIRVDDLECDSKGGGTSEESSLKKKEVRKRARDVEVLVMGMKESATLVQHALDNLADSIKNSEPHKRIGDEVYRELMKIEGLTRDDIDVTHEWLTLRKEMAAVFLSHGDKKEWVLRRLHRIHAASFP